MLHPKRGYHTKHLLYICIVILSLCLLLQITTYQCVAVYKMLRSHCEEVKAVDLMADPFRDHHSAMPRLIMGDVDICRHPNLTHLIYVHLSPSNINTRTNIRSTWADRNLFTYGKTKVVFFMGKPATDQVQQMLYIENRVYGDVIQGDFNGTEEEQPLLNAIFGLDFMVKHCSNVPYFINSHEQSVINIFEMIKLTEHYGGLLKQYIICDTRSGLGLDRNFPSSGLVSDVRQAFPGQMCYPTHCSEAFYALPYRLVKNLHSAIGKSKFIWRENIYITGLLMKIVAVEQDIHFIPLNNDVTSSYTSFRRGYRDEMLPIWPVVLTDIEDPQTFKDSWLLMLDRIPKTLLSQIHINWNFMDGNPYE